MMGTGNSPIKPCHKLSPQVPHALFAVTQNSTEQPYRKMWEQMNRNPGMLVSNVGDGVKKGTTVILPVLIKVFIKFH